MAELISVIMPVYNKQAYVDRAIRSLVEQSHQNLEILLVNDGSTDGSAEICKAWAARDARVRYLEQANAGPSAARNTGLAAASGDYIAFLDADDSMRPHALEKMLTLMQNCQADLVVADQMLWQGNQAQRNTKLAGHPSGLISKEDFMYSLAVYTIDIFWGQQGNKLYRKSILVANGIRFDETRKHAEDFLFNLNCFQATQHIAYLNEVSCDLYDVPLSLSKEINMALTLQWGGDVWRALDAFLLEQGAGQYRADANAFFCVIVSTCMDGMKQQTSRELASYTKLLRQIAQVYWVRACIRDARPHTRRQWITIQCFRKRLYGLLGLLYWAKHRIK